MSLIPGCLVAALLVGGGAAVVSHTGAWQRFNGSTLATGEFTLRVEGAIQTTAKGSGAIARTSSWAGSDGYTIQLAAADLGLALNTRNRVPPGLYPVRPSAANATGTPVDTMAATVWRGAGGPIFWGDSGTVMVTRDGKRLRGEFRIFLTNRFNPPMATSPPHIVVSGEFTSGAP